MSCSPPCGYYKSEVTSILPASPKWSWNYPTTIPRVIREDPDPDYISSDMKPKTLGSIDFLK